MTTRCTICKNHVNVNVFFSNERIIMREYPQFNTEEYIAEIKGRFICPVCGADVNKIYSATITKNDIIKLTAKDEM